MWNLIQEAETAKLLHQERLRRAEQESLAYQLDTRPAILSPLLAKMGVLLSVTGTWLQRQAEKPVEPSTPCTTI
jgi:hypothetical protein